MIIGRSFYSVFSCCLVDETFETVLFRKILLFSSTLDFRKNNFLSVTFNRCAEVYVLVPYAILFFSTFAQGLQSSKQLCYISIEHSFNNLCTIYDFSVNYFEKYFVTTEGTVFN